MNIEDLAALGVGEDLAKQIAALHEKSTGGLKAKNDELLGKLASQKTESQELQSLRQEFAPFIEYVQKAQANEHEAQQAELAKQGKIDELLELKSKPLQHKNSELEKALADAQAAQKEAVAKYNETLIVNAMSSAIGDAKVFIPEAMNIAKLHASNFEVVDGTVITKEGKPVADWINSDFKQSNPFLIAQGQGSGANGSQGGQQKPKVNEAAQKAKEKGDIQGYLKAKMTQEG